MIGHGMEEGLMQQVDNPSHLDIARISVPTGAVAAILCFFLFRGPIGYTAALWIAPFIFPLVSYLVHRKLEGAKITDEAARLEERRNAQEDSARRAVAEMKARERASR